MTMLKNIPPGTLLVIPGETHKDPDKHILCLRQTPTTTEMILLKGDKTKQIVWRHLDYTNLEDLAPTIKIIYPK